MSPNSNNNNNTTSVMVEAVSASIGGAISSSALYPLEVIKTKMQANNDETEKSSAVEYTIHMYDKGGLAPFYKGVQVSAFQSALEKGLYFFSYTFLKKVYVTMSGQREMPTSVNLLVGCMAEWMHLPVTLPVDCLTTAIQTNNSNETFCAIWSRLMKRGGGMYKGTQAYAILCLKPAIQYTFYEQVKHLVLLRRRSTHELAAGEAFFLGMVARAIATVLVFPFLRAKVVLQSGQSSFKSIPSMLSHMFQGGGLPELYQGIGPELTRGVMSAAIMMMIKEKITGFVQRHLQS